MITFPEQYRKRRRRFTILNADGDTPSIQRGQALRCPAGDEGLICTPSAAFDTAMSASTTLSINIWAYHTPTQASREGIFGRGRRAPDEGGVSISKHFGSGTAGDIWTEHALLGNDMGSGRYATFMNDPIVENTWQMLTYTYDSDGAGDARVRFGVNSVLEDATTIVGSLPPDFSAMVNGDWEVGRQVGFYDGGSNTTTRYFREAAVWFRVLNQGEINALYNGGSAAVPTDAELYLPMGNDTNEQSSFATSLTSNASLVDVSSLGGPFA